MKILLEVSMLMIILLEAPRLVRGRLWRELAVFMVILIVAYTLAFLYVFDVIGQ